jgi:hypothetical protein
MHIDTITWIAISGPIIASIKGEENEKETLG